MASVSKSAFLRPLRKNTERYPLPEYGEDAYVVIQALTSKDIVALQASYGKSPDSGNLAFVYELFVRCLVDDQGQPIFEDASEVGTILDLSVPAMESLVEACLRVSGIKSEREPEKN